MTRIAIPAFLRTSPATCKQIDTTETPKARATPQGESSTPIRGVVNPDHVLAVMAAYGGVDLYEGQKKPGG